MTLDVWLTLSGMTEQAFAERVKTTQWNVNRWRHGKRLPRPALMRRVAIATDFLVKPEDFYGALEGCDA